MNKSLLAITVGPVQTYIQDSRKLTDLYNSSKIISDIMKEIYRYILDNTVQAELIYPNHTDGIDDDIDYSNYMILEIQGDINLKDIEDTIYEKIISKNNNKIEYLKSMKEVFHLFWAIEEIEEDKYGEAYEKLTRLMSSLKNTYQFEQLEQESKKKCLICGKRNIITDSLKEEKKEAYRLSSDEELCEACFFKRQYKSDSDKILPSIYAIAIENWKRFYNNELKKLSSQLQDLFFEIDKYYHPKEIDKLTQFLHSTKVSDIQKYTTLQKRLKKLTDDMKEKILEEEKEEDKKKKLKVNENKLNEIKEKINKIKEIMKEVYSDKNEEGRKRVQLPNYEYSFIQFDIDNLGRWMSGKYLKDKTKLKSYQQDISLALITFAKKLKENLRDKCKIIYAGGDDFLSILPSENIIEVMEIIEQQFENEVENKLSDYMSADREITYSTSITIAPCKDPMSYALAKTREELENVKKRYKEESLEKNGVAINYIINNGKEITYYFQKDKLKQYFQLIKEFKKVKTAISFAYMNHFIDEFKDFDWQDKTHEENRNILQIVRYEAQRLITRATNKTVAEETLKEYIKKLVDFIVNTFEKNMNEGKTNHTIVDFNNIIHALNIYQKLCEDYIRLDEYSKGGNQNVFQANEDKAM